MCFEGDAVKSHLVMTHYMRLLAIITISWSYRPKERQEIYIPFVPEYVEENLVFRG